MRIACAETQAMNDAAAARGTWLIWIVTNAATEHPGKVAASAHETDYLGGTVLLGTLERRAYRRT